MEFYYPNMQNDMWRIMGLVFFGDKDYFITGKSFDKVRLEDFLAEKKIALGDTAHSVVRLQGNASDNFLQVVEPVDLHGLLARIPDCHTVVTTGQKATDTLRMLTGAPEPKVGESVDFLFDGRPMRFWRMPSSSRAYPKPLAEKAEIYARMLRETLDL
jgi:G:T/U-mismatch repair DNA glycosylase